MPRWRIAAGIGASLLSVLHSAAMWALCPCAGLLAGRFAPGCSAVAYGEGEKRWWAEAETLSLGAWLWRSPLLQSA